MSLYDCEQRCCFSAWFSGCNPCCHFLFQPKLGGRACCDSRGGTGSEAVRRPPLCCQTVEVEVQGGKSEGHQAGFVVGVGEVDIKPSTPTSTQVLTLHPHHHTQTHTPVRQRDALSHPGFLFLRQQLHYFVVHWWQRWQQSSYVAWNVNRHSVCVPLRGVSTCVWGGREASDA